jgi:hypothetical protein
MSNALLISLLTIGFLSSCNKAKQNPPSSTLTSNLQVIETDINITVKDYHDEAKSIKTEAKEIILRAKEIKCGEARKLAESVISISQKAERNSNLIRVEQYIEQASITLAHAEDAIIYCDDNDEISFASDLKDEQ